MSNSTFMPMSLLSLPDKSALCETFIGKALSTLRTPALVVDRGIFRRNCERVVTAAKEKGLDFRAHVKTHKTSEGIRIQAESGGGVRAMIASTMVEVCQILGSGLVEEGLFDDILLSMPISADKLEDLTNLQCKVSGRAILRIMVDHPAQIDAINQFAGRTKRDKWSAFIKVDGGGRRAGVPPQSSQLRDLITACLHSNHVDIFGFYSHFGQSYSSKSLEVAVDYFNGEVSCVNTAAKVARDMGAKGDWVLSVGATPTAHAAIETGELGYEGLEGRLELHAGCYCMLDLQQYATSMVEPSSLALTVLSRVVSIYPHRKEGMCDAGALACSKDTGPLPGFGHVVSPQRLNGWDLGRVSQEHGTLVHRPGVDGVGELEVGDVLKIVPQHACLTCAGHPWIYVVEDGKEEVVDVWVTWKGW